MRRALYLIATCIALFANSSPIYAHSNGVTSVHEIASKDSPNATLQIRKDPTGGFNVYVKTSNFVWRPEMASIQHIAGQGHAHVYLDGRKIMRIYNQWFHLNTFQFSTKAGEQLVSVEFVGNDHAPYTIEGLPVGAEQIVDVPSDEIQPKSSNLEPIYIGAIALLFTLLAALLFRIRRGK